jgi:hypothetical protein
MKTALKPLMERETSTTLPAIMAGAGKPATLRFLEFFIVNMRNRNTRAAYARAAGDFWSWCEGM